MNVSVPQISWHFCDPLYTCSIHPTNSSRLVTGGTRGTIYLWLLDTSQALPIPLTIPSATTTELPQQQQQQPWQPKIELISSLKGHKQSVNVIRWNSDGQYLASGSDDSLIYVWKYTGDIKSTSEQQQGVNGLGWNDDVELLSKEKWTNYIVLHGHLEAVLDLQWSSNDEMILSGSFDKTAILWNVQQRQKLHLFSDIHGYVQGVCIHPFLKYFATLSTDKSLRIFNKKFTCVHNIRKLRGQFTSVTLPENEPPPTTTTVVGLKSPERDGITKIPGTNSSNGQMLFLDENAPTFFRRANYLPDGSCLIVPAGCLDQTVINGLNNQNQTNDHQECQESTKERRSSSDQEPSPAVIGQVNCAYLFPTTFKDMNRPSNIIPCGDQEVIGVIVCNGLFTSVDNNGTYRQLFAVLTKSSILFFDNLSQEPFAYVKNIHLLTITDGSWSHDGRLFITCSEDGYCTVVTFTEECLAGSSGTSKYLTNTNEILQQMSQTTNANNKL
ncbi:unnamed protein product [Didymodactylos carnosus]|uniref:CAF1B/HIR1 beta-propeller domain-containing protein n=1 Tax=Didymodactylos carnosus TaxID=1234261 RepID=A0A813TCE1_9BILA|nr:unnamed protein product [Didymodactylos carnosus]CAF3594316.1 unnamed protein product [Didymodactylos carnosus]